MLKVLLVCGLVLSFTACGKLPDVNVTVNNNSSGTPSGIDSQNGPGAGQAQVTVKVRAQ